MQEAPTTLKVELTEGCNLWCSFCGLKGIRAAPLDNLKFMSIDTARRAVEMLHESGWNPRIEFAMHGEPTLNPEWRRIIAYFADYHTMLTTNGWAFTRTEGLSPSEIAYECIRACLDTVAIDAYEYANIYRKIRDDFVDEGVDFYEYPEDPNGNPHKRHSRPTTMFTFIEDLAKTANSTRTGTHNFISNHSGAAGPKDYTVQTRCARPFRELVIHQDGGVGLCCDDWRRKLPITNIYDHKTLEDIWQHPKFRAIRRFLYHGMRRIGPCAGCTSRSPRTGLLPDKFGKKSLPEPNDADEILLRTALQDGPLANVVKREWE